MNYLDFELRIGEGDGTTYPVTVMHAAAGGEPSISTIIPVNDEIFRVMSRHIFAQIGHFSRSIAFSKPLSSLPDGIFSAEF